MIVKVRRPQQLFDLIIGHLLRAKFQIGLQKERRVALIRGAVIAFLFGFFLAEDHGPQGLRIHNSHLRKLLELRLAARCPRLYLILLPVLLNALGVLCEFHGANTFLKRLLRRTQANNQICQRVAVIEARLEEMRELAIAVRNVNDALGGGKATREELAIVTTLFHFNLRSRTLLSHFEGLNNGAEG